MVELELDHWKHQLGEHPLYRAITSVERLRVFMEHHVYAVWDFMSLAKRLQQELTSIDVPWTPGAVPGFARLINEIVLEEESDQDGRGGYASHFALYLEAMREVGADTRAVEQVVGAVAHGQPPEEAMEAAGAPAAAQAFVSHTLTIARQAPLHGVAAAFFYGREDLIPTLFSALMRQWRLDGRPVERFVYYLDRHIEVDGDKHGPMVRRLLEALCEGRPDRLDASRDIAQRVMRARLALWDAIDQAMV
ncbi:DUF3050 domain-containing protein [Sulfobacillus harzensis]|nr:DUF3050 domain-containing protein [Sulfobacillus harzensis]